MQHAPQYPNIGTGSSLQLLDWLQQLTFPLEAKFSDLEFAKQVYPEVVRRNLKLGVSHSQSRNPILGNADCWVDNDVLLLCYDTRGQYPITGGHMPRAG